MLGKKSIIAALLTVALAYVAYPYVTLYQLGSAIRHGDGVALETLVDWPTIREGIKEDICDLVIDETAEAKTGAQLPPFGAGFVRGIAANAVDARVTPQALVTVAHHSVAKPAPRGADVHVSWAFFSSPMQFVVDLRAPDLEAPVRLQMDLRHGTWQVTRVWLPPELLGQTNTQTAAASGRVVQKTDIAERIQ